MADNSSSNVASIAIVVLIVLAIFAFYFLFNRGVSANRAIDVDVNVPDRIERPLNQ